MQSPGATASPLKLDDVIRITDALRNNLERVIEGKDEVIRTTIAVLLAGGHLLVEDVPGVGKTVLAKALARSIDATTRRIQFTPDLLPSDITGVTMFDQPTGNFIFREGAVFANIVIGDEINRASPKTQSALLEAMAEHHVTLDGTTRPLPTPFMVIATQNPLEMDGTFPLPEAQRDRFMAQVSMGYPSAAAEFAMLSHHGVADPLVNLQPIATAPTIAAAIEAVRHLHTSDALRQYIVDLVTATRNHASVHFGASPRASLQVLSAARAHAALAGRDYALPLDVQQMAGPVLAHRLVLSRAGRGANREELMERIVESCPVPAGRQH